MEVDEYFRSHSNNNNKNDEIVTIEDEEDDDDLLVEIPERNFVDNEKYLLHSEKSEQTLNEVVSLIDDEIKRDDSGLGTCDTMEVLKENIVNHSLEILNCESNDSVIDKNENSMPELFSMPNLYLMKDSNEPIEYSGVNEQEEMPQLIPLTIGSNLPENISCTENDSLPPQLFPIPSAMLEPKSNEETPVNSRRSSASSSFIDSLLNKLRRNNSESSGSELSPTKLQKSSTATSDEDLLVEIENPVQYSKSSNPNMLPTPIVKNQRIASAFVNSDEEYAKAIAKTKHKRIQLEQEDKSKMSAKSQPPRMKQPKLLKNVPHPRTLAEKRALVSGNVDFLMIEQESKIYKQIQRKTNGKDVNHGLLNSIMCEDIPINYGPWKALSWLRTRDGRYIHQYLNIDGQNIKLIGSRGNHYEKFLPSQSNKPFQKFQKSTLRSSRCCDGGKVKKKITENLLRLESIRRFVLEESLEPYKKLEAKNLYNQLSSIRPRPLAKKIELINKNRKLLNADEDSAFLGNFSKFKMPDIMLEVRVEHKSPLDAVAKQYLNEIMPFRDMNENWINFSLSALKTKNNIADDSLNNNVFEFKIPYDNDKQNILVREIVKSRQDTEQLRIFDSTESDKDEMAWTFDKNANKDDLLEMEIVDVIKDLTNSVFINLNDDLFTKDDEHDRSVVICPIKAKDAIDEISTLKSDKSKKMLLELRRLNANVFKSETSRVDDVSQIYVKIK